MPKKRFQHVVRLTNGKHLLIEEDNNGLSIATLEEDIYNASIGFPSIEVELYICRIDWNGVLVYPWGDIAGLIEGLNNA